jgi:hypothetical protein
MSDCIGWTTASLSESCLLITDGTHHSPANGPTGDFKYITAKNIKRTGLDLTHITYVDAGIHAEIYRRCPVRKGDLLYIKDGATTGIAIINPLADPFSLLSSVALIRPDPLLLSAEFLCHLLNSPELYQQMIGDMTGSAIRRLTLTAISRQIVSIPPLPEQRRIVAQIDSLSAKSKRARDHLDHIPRLVEKYRQAILVAAYLDAERLSVERGTLGALALEVRNGLSKKPLDVPSGPAILRISSVRPLRVRLDDVRYYPEAVPEIALLRDGDLLFTRYNGNPDFVAVCGVVRGLKRDTAYPDKLDLKMQSIRGLRS